MPMIVTSRHFSTCHKRERERESARKSESERERDRVRARKTLIGGTAPLITTVPVFIPVGVGSGEGNTEQGETNENVCKRQMKMFVSNQT
jgi:hypothetical protein